jgi:hypothetical protein
MKHIEEVGRNRDRKMRQGHRDWLRREKGEEGQERSGLRHQRVHGYSPQKGKTNSEAEIEKAFLRSSLVRPGYLPIYVPPALTPRAVVLWDLWVTSPSGQDVD